MNEKQEATSWYIQEHPLLILLCLLAFAEMAGLGLAKHLGYNTRYFDLGAMSQAVWSVTQGEPLVFSGRGIPLSRLAQGVEVFYVVLAPFYLLFPTPMTLIVCQAALYALAAIPLHRWATRRLSNSRYSLVMVAIYLLYPVAQTTILFEIHGDAFAMPLLIFALEALDRKAWRSYWVWLLLSLSAKHYVVAPVAALGVVLWIRGQRRLGLATLALTLAWGAITYLIVFPTFTPSGAAAEAAHAAADSYLSTRFQALDLGSTAVLRLTHAVIVLMPALIVLGWRAPLWLVPAAVIAVPALLSTGFGPSYSYRTHHYAAAVPFLMAAILHAAARQRVQDPGGQRTKRPPWKGRLVLTLIVVLIFNIAFVDTPLSPFFYRAAPGSGSGLDEGTYGVTARDAFKDEWLTETVPAGAPTAASCILATRLANRELLYLTRRPLVRPLEDVLPEVDYVVTDALYDYVTGATDPDHVIYSGGVLFERGVIRTLLQAPEFGLVAARDGLVMFSRQGAGQQQTVTTMPRPGSTGLQARFSDEIGLVQQDITYLGSRRFRLTADWVALADLNRDVPRIAVSRLEGMAHMRIAHLPTMALLPTTRWQQDDLIRETIEFTIPAEVPDGRHVLKIGWYDAGNLFAAATDDRSRLGQEATIAVLDLQ